MAEDKISSMKIENLPTPKKELTEQRVLELIDAYINSPGGLRLKTGIATEVEGWAIAADGTFTTSKQIISTLATGTKPLDVTSTTMCTNLNADQVDGYDLNQSVTTSGTPTFADVTISGDHLQISTSKTPSAANDTGTAGQICWDADYIYVCVATDTWERVGIATW